MKETARFLIASLLNTLQNGQNFKNDILAKYYLAPFHFVSKTQNESQGKMELLVDNVKKKLELQETIDYKKIIDKE